MKASSGKKMLVSGLSPAQENSPSLGAERMTNTSPARGAAENTRNSPAEVRPE